MPGSAINSPLFQVSHFKFTFKNTFHNGVLFRFVLTVDIDTITHLLLFLILLSQLDYIYFAYRFLSSHNLRDILHRTGTNIVFSNFQIILLSYHLILILIF